MRMSDSAIAYGNCHLTVRAGTIYSHVVHTRLIFDICVPGIHSTSQGIQTMIRVLTAVSSSIHDRLFSSVSYSSNKTRNDLLFIFRFSRRPSTLHTPHNPHRIVFSFLPMLACNIPVARYSTKQATKASKAGWVELD